SSIDETSFIRVSLPPMTTFTSTITVCLLLLAAVLFAPPAHASLLIKPPSYLGLQNGLVGFWSFDQADIAGTTIIPGCRYPSGSRTRQHCRNWRYKWASIRWGSRLQWRDSTASRATALMLTSAAARAYTIASTVILTTNPTRTWGQSRSRRSMRSQFTSA